MPPKNVTELSDDDTQRPNEIEKEVPETIQPPKERDATSNLPVTPPAKPAPESAPIPKKKVKKVIVKRVRPAAAKSKSPIKDDDDKSTPSSRDGPTTVEPDEDSERVTKKPAMKRPAAAKSQPKAKVQSKAKEKAKGRAGGGKLIRMDTAVEKGLKVTLNRYKRDGSYGVCLGEHEVLKAACLALHSIGRTRACFCSISLFPKLA